MVESQKMHRILLLVFGIKPTNTTQVLALITLVSQSLLISETE
jgi:hypothetical protein